MHITRIPGEHWLPSPRHWVLTLELCHNSERDCVAVNPVLVYVLERGLVLKELEVQSCDVVQEVPRVLPNLKHARGLGAVFLQCADSSVPRVRALVKSVQEVNTLPVDFHVEVLIGRNLAALVQRGGIGPVRIRAHTHVSDSVTHISVVIKLHEIHEELHYRAESGNLAQVHTRCVRPVVDTCREHHIVHATQVSALP